MNLSAYGRSVIRTTVPLLVGAVVGWLATRGVKVDASSIIPAVDAAIGAIYYAAVRAVEHRWPQAGWLLGAPGVPSYAPAGSGPAAAPAAPEGLSGASGEALPPGFPQG